MGASRGPHPPIYPPYGPRSAPSLAPIGSPAPIYAVGAPRLVRIHLRSARIAEAGYRSGAAPVKSGGS